MDERLKIFVTDCDAARVLRAAGVTDRELELINLINPLEMAGSLTSQHKKRESILLEIERIHKNNGDLSKIPTLLSSLPEPVSSSALATERELLTWAFGSSVSNDIYEKHSYDMKIYAIKKFIYETFDNPDYQDLRIQAFDMFSMYGSMRLIGIGIKVSKNDAALKNKETAAQLRETVRVKWQSSGYPPIWEGNQRSPYGAIKAIARELNLSEATIKRYIKN